MEQNIKTDPTPFSISGNIVDVVNKRIFQGTITITNGVISKIVEAPVPETQFIMPGLIDAHVHIESSMVTPARFAEKAVVHGTVATVSDPHEIANVLGIEGVKFMIANGKETPFKFFFGAPSCVPATPFESAGAVIDASQVAKLLQMDDIYYLAEMMNFPGVIFNDPEVMAKLKAAKAYNKPIDGHAPGLQGDDLAKYAHGGISTDHECMTVDEALAKIGVNIKVQIREGSAAKNFEALLPLVKLHPEMVMFCSDDKHPDELTQGHLNVLLQRAVAMGYDPLTLISICTKNVAEHYHLPVGLLQQDDPADLIVVDSLSDFNVLKTFINGNLVAENGTCLFEVSPLKVTPNNFNATPVNAEDLRIPTTYDSVKVIEVEDGQLYTRSSTAHLQSKNGYLLPDLKQDVLKIVVLNRYQKATPAVAFIRGFGLKQGALASSIAHDSHNIVAVGTSDEEIVAAINLVIANKGGISGCSGPLTEVLPLPVAGIMSNESIEAIAEKYLILSGFAKYLGTPLSAPFMTLAFMSLLVIPELKLGDKGLFDGTKFEFTSVYE
jgi:adenine deaminase